MDLSKHSHVHGHEVCRFLEHLGMGIHPKMDEVHFVERAVTSCGPFVRPLGAA